MKLHLIYARACNGVIGRKNALPWHIPEDMVHFKKTTADCPVIMGRNTWDSIPVMYRPLKGRLNVVLSRQANWYQPGATRMVSLPKALELCSDYENVWVIGGAAIYKQALPYASTAVVTEIDAAFSGDVYAPVLGSDWLQTKRIPIVTARGLPIAFVTYTNQNPISFLKEKTE